MHTFNPISLKCSYKKHINESILRKLVAFIHTNKTISQNIPALKHIAKSYL